MGVCCLRSIAVAAPTHAHTHTHTRPPTHTHVRRQLLNNQWVEYPCALGRSKAQHTETLATAQDALDKCAADPTCHAVQISNTTNTINNSSNTINNNASGAVDAVFSTTIDMDFKTNGTTYLQSPDMAKFVDCML